VSISAFGPNLWVVNVNDIMAFWLRGMSIGLEISALKAEEYVLLMHWMMFVWYKSKIKPDD
jgi:hypothetical protein